EERGAGPRALAGDRRRTGRPRAPAPGRGTGMNIAVCLRAPPPGPEGDAIARGDGQALAIGLRRIGADLILTGVRSDDEGLGAAPAAIARHLGAAYVAAVEEIAIVDERHVEVVARGGG